MKLWWIKFWTWPRWGLELAFVLTRAGVQYHQISCLHSHSALLNLSNTEILARIALCLSHQIAKLHWSKIPQKPKGFLEKKKIPFRNNTEQRWTWNRDSKPFHNVAQVVHYTKAPSKRHFSFIVIIIYFCIYWPIAVNAQGSTAFF